MSRHVAVLSKVREAVALVDGRRVYTIRVQQPYNCVEAMPCQGHGAALISLWFHWHPLVVQCRTGEELGALMWYYGVQNAHFTGQVDDQLAAYLREHLSRAT